MACNSLFSMPCMWPPCCTSTYVSGRNGGNLLRATDDLQDREISAAEIRSFQPKWEYGGGARRGTEGAFRPRLPKYHSGLARPEAGGSRRSEVSQELRGAGCEA